MATYTSNYQLHQWVPEDDFLRTDFNTDFQKIDAGIRAAKAQAEALAVSKAELVAGQYSGDNKPTRNINLGFQPVAVLVEVCDGARTSSDAWGGLAVADGAVISGGSTAVKLTAGGFQVRQESGPAQVNRSGYHYHYIALH